MIPFYSVLSSILRHKRTCPKCRKTQLVQSSRKNETVKCKFCKAKIPRPVRK